MKKTENELKEMVKQAFINDDNSEESIKNIILYTDLNGVTSQVTVVYTICDTYHYWNVQLTKTEKIKEHSLRITQA